MAENETVSVDLESFKQDIARAFDATLKAELAGLELRLVDRLSKSLTNKADASIVAEQDKRIMSLETARAAREHLAGDVIVMQNRIGALERFRYTVPSVAFVSLVLSIVLACYYALQH